MFKHPLTPFDTLRRTREIGRKAGLQYAYEGNVPGERDQSCYCRRCEALLIGRIGFFVRQNRIRGGASPECGAVVDGLAMSSV